MRRRHGGRVDSEYIRSIDRSPQGLVTREGIQGLCLDLYSDRYVFVLSCQSRMSQIKSHWGRSKLEDHRRLRELSENGMIVVSRM